MTAIQTTNSSVGVLVAPIGVHSLMHGVGHKSDEPLTPAVAEALAVEFNDLFAGIHRAVLHGRFRTAELLHRIGAFGQPAIPTADYLSAVGDLGIPEEEGLVSLITFIRDPLVWLDQHPGVGPADVGPATDA
jgi:hypothetical protein